MPASHAHPDTGDNSSKQAEMFVGTHGADE